MTVMVVIALKEATTIAKATTRGPAMMVGAMGVTLVTDAMGKAGAMAIIRLTGILRLHTAAMATVQ